MCEEVMCQMRLIIGNTSSWQRGSLANLYQPIPRQNWDYRPWRNKDTNAKTSLPNFQGWATDNFFWIRHKESFKFSRAVWPHINPLVIHLGRPCLFHACILLFSISRSLWL
jgi:hypothetical protein